MTHRCACRQSDPCATPQAHTIRPPHAGPVECVGRMQGAHLGGWASMCVSICPAIVSCRAMGWGGVGWVGDHCLVGSRHVGFSLPPFWPCYRSLPEELIVGSPALLGAPHLRYRKMYRHGGRVACKQTSCLSISPPYLPSSLQSCAAAACETAGCPRTCTCSLAHSYSS